MATLSIYNYYGEGQQAQWNLSNQIKEQRSIVVPCLVTDVDAGVDDDIISDCRDVIVAEHGEFHPADSTLPLDSVRLVWQSKDPADASKRQIIAHAIYKRGVLTNSTLPAFEVGTEVQSGLFQKNIYLETDGTTLASGSYGYYPISYPGYASEYQINITTTIASTDTAAMAQLATAATKDGFVNSDSVTILGITRPAQTLRYVGTSKSVVHTSGTAVVKYSLTHHLKYQPLGYSTRRVMVWGFGVPPSDAPWNDNPYYVRDVIDPQSTAFAGLFPTHGGESAWGGTDGVAPILSSAWSRPA